MTTKALANRLMATSHWPTPASAESDTVARAVNA